MMLVRLVLLPLLSLGGIGLAAYSVRSGSTPTPKTPGLSMPPATPFPQRISATGVVEARSRNIALGVARPGLVVAQPHAVGATVQAGELLLQIDDRDARARLAARAAERRSAEQEVARLRAMPRPEELAPRQANVRMRTAQLADARSLLRIVADVADPRAVSAEERTRRETAVAVAEQTLAEAEAQLALVQAGAWAPDLAVAEARAAAATAAEATIEAELAQLQVKAPFAGRILQVNVRVGEYATTGTQGLPAIVLGDVSVLHVRADVDEMDVWRLREDRPARAYVRGNSHLSAPLRFVAVEPLMVPKRALSGSSREQVDTRVLQVLFALEPKDLPVQVGQLVDVYVEAPAAPGGTAPAGQGAPK